MGAYAETFTLGKLHLFFYKWFIPFVCITMYKNFVQTRTKMQRCAAELFLFGWRTAKKDCEHFLIKIYFYTVCSTGMRLQLKGTILQYREHDYKEFKNHKKPIKSAIKPQIQTPSLVCLSDEERDGLTDPWKRPYQKRPQSHQFMRWQRRWHASQVPPHHPALYSGVTSSLTRGLKKMVMRFFPPGRPRNKQ